MATLNHATTTASQKRGGTISLASILYTWFGLAFLISSLLIGISVLLQRSGQRPNGE